MKYDEYEKLLLEERERLFTSLNDIGRSIEQKKDWVVKIGDDEEEHTDPLDDADITEELERDIATLNVLEQQYQRVEEALKRIENETYGVCVICGKEIKEDRLRANPTATTCKAHMDEEKPVS